MIYFEIATSIISGLHILYIRHSSYIITRIQHFDQPYLIGSIPPAQSYFTAEREFTASGAADCLASSSFQLPLSSLLIGIAVTLLETGRSPSRL
jgi:hypothetical protein